MTVDAEQSRLALTLIDKIMETEAPDGSWMSPELIDTVTTMVEAARILAVTHLAMRGMPVMKAKKLMDGQEAAIGFHLGYLIGQEAEKTRAFRAMMEGPDD